MATTTVQSPDYLNATELRADLRARFAPSPEQITVAKAMHAGSPGAYAVLVPIALPGKTSGVWVEGQAVEYPPGYFLAHTSDWNGAGSYAACRNEAEAVAERHLAATGGIPAYASIHPDGHWAVFEGFKAA